MSYKTNRFAQPGHELVGGSPMTPEALRLLDDGSEEATAFASYNAAHLLQHGANSSPSFILIVPEGPNPSRRGKTHLAYHSVIN